MEKHYAKHAAHAKHWCNLAVAGLFGLPLSAQAQGMPGGTARGTEQGDKIGGSPTAAGGVAGSEAGLPGAEQCPRFREYVTGEHIPSAKSSQPVTVGMVLPSAGITLYAIPREFGVASYRYAVVNQKVVLVKPTTREVVDVID